MTETQDTTRQSAVQIALELRRKELAGELPRLQRARDAARDVLTGCVDDVTYVEQQLTELDAALAASMQTVSREELYDLVQMLNPAAVVVVDSENRPAIAWCWQGSPAVLTPAFAQPVNLDVLSYPVRVIGEATR